MTGERAHSTARTGVRHQWQQRVTKDDADAPTPLDARLCDAAAGVLRVCCLLTEHGPVSRECDGCRGHDGQQGEEQLHQGRVTKRTKQ